MRMRLLGAGLCVALLCASSVRAAEDVVVSAQANGPTVVIEARATLLAPHALVWAALTDYNHLADFIPDMHSSRVTGRYGSTSIVEQDGEAGFIIFSYGIKAVVASTEYPPNVIEISVLKGNLKQLGGRYQIEKNAENGKLVLHWFGVIEPAVSLPEFIRVPLIRSSIEKQFRGMVDEIERRDARRRVRMAVENVR